jgi:DNA-binding CsgD family transcriptional regulator
LAARPVPAGARDGATWSVMLYARGLVALHDDDLHGAKDLLMASAAHQHSHGEHNPLALPWRQLLAECYRLLGDRDRALETLTEERQLLSQWSGTTVLTDADLALATTTDDSEQVANAVASVVALRVSPAKLTYAHVLVQLATALLDADPEHDIGSLLDEAQSIVDPYPCHRLRTHIKRLDDRRGIQRGAPAAPPPHPEWARLSPAEQRIVAMAARGHANGDIAEKFAITKRTVEVHLTRAYRKLRISGRAELPELVENARR